MPDNPFKPPDAKVRDQPPRPGSPLRAILVGLAVDIGGSTLAGIVLALFNVASLAASGMSAEQIAAAVKNVEPTSTLAILGMLVGAGFSVAGGYACARIARRDEYRIGGAMAALSAIAGLLLGGSGQPGDMLALETLTTIACVLLGVKYGRAANGRRPPEPRR